MIGSVTKYPVSGTSRPRWRYRLSIGMDPQGKRLYATAAGFGTEKAARDAMGARKKEIDQTSAVPPLRLFIHPPSLIGGQPAILTIKFGAPISQPNLRVGLTTSDPTAIAPEFVLFKPGEDSSTVEVQTQPVDEEVTLFVTATAGQVSGSVSLTLVPSPPAEPEYTLNSWLQHWLDRYAPERCQPKTLERYRQLAGYLDRTGIAETRLRALTHSGIEEGLYNLLKAPGKRREHVSARSVRHVAALLNVALNKAYRLDLLAVNPMARVELPTVQKKDAASLSPDQMQKLRETCRGDWTFALVELALAIGARRGELLALTWDDIDWITRTVTLSKSLEETKAGLRLKRPKSNKSRSCQIPRSTIIALQFLHDQQAEHRRLFGPDYQDLGLIFCQPDGAYCAPHLVSQVIVRRMRTAGIESGSLHTLRHAHASNLLSKGIPLPAVSARLGHSDSNVTGRIYSHALPADDQRSADVWDTIIDGKVQ
ncbi:MAG: site-specific integrase [Acidobacteria bacterium]|nr:site-specific integrase [Acidobacteriota bacterium]